MPCWSLPFTYCRLDSFQSLKPSLLPEVHGDSVQNNALIVWELPSDLLPRSFALNVYRLYICYSMDRIQKKSYM
jgi:hypothetical protein